MKITVEDAGCITPEASRRNLAINKGRGLPYIGPLPKSGKRVAVIGGAPSVVKYVEDMQNWDGPRWALNGAWAWCRDNGIEADFFACDPQPVSAFGAGFSVEGCKRAYLGPTCDQTLFDALDGADIKLFHGLGYGTVATATIFAAARMGHSGVIFVGCDGSRGERSHAYLDEPDSNIHLCLVECGGKEYITDPILLTQCKFIVDVARAKPHFISATPDGLLAAMLQNDGEYEVTIVTPELAARMKPA